MVSPRTTHYPFRMATIEITFSDEIKPETIELYLATARRAFSQIGHVSIAQTPADFAKPLRDRSEE